VSLVRRLSGERRVGHAGTLDPAATGVLPVCLGQATRITQYLQDGAKEYIAGIELGASTDTYDREGAVIARGDASNVTTSLIEGALAAFTGEILQAPPAFSAVKVKGRQSYELARAGIEVEHPPRTVHIHSIEPLEYALPYFRIRVRCAKGTYIRSLANDLGSTLGCGAYLKDLVRSACGPFTLEGALTPQALREAAETGRLAPLLFPVDYPLYGWEKAVVTPGEAQRLAAGSDIALGLPSVPAAEYCRAYAEDGRFLAVMKFVPESKLWHPEKVFNL
jgi:tRNA pseudouridine55 synthase